LRGNSPRDATIEAAMSLSNAAALLNDAAADAAGKHAREQSYALPTHAQQQRGT
jgi:hypothetical protein